MSVAYQIGFTAGDNGQGEMRMSDVLFETFGVDLTDRDCVDAKRGFDDGVMALRRRLWVTMYTTAPESYDAFNTFTVDVVGTTRCGRNNWRRVMIDPRHVEWHRMRYSSGLYPCHDQAGWDKLVRTGLVRTVRVA